MPGLAHHAEIQKLALTLGCAPEALSYLDKVDVPAIRALRERATAVLFDADAHLFGRVAAATKLLPTPLAAVIAEKALGALLCARIAGQLPVERAVDIAKRLKSGFLADVCIEIDPRQVRELLERIPVDRVVDVARELARRKAYIVMGRFVDCLPEPAMRAVLDALRDDEALLRIGLFVEDPAQLDAVIAMLPADRLRNMIAVAVHHGAELWGEALALINAIGPHPRRRMAAIAAALDDASIARMLDLTQTQELWPQLLPLIAEMPDAERARLARAPGLHDDTVLAALIRATDSSDRWPQLLPLVAQMDASLQQRAAAVAAGLGDEIVARLNDALRGLVAKRRDARAGANG
ncbi:MAG: hypothetical protein ACPHN2_08395 [Sinimarinibacterium flocculans]|uniref:hypothetical protein n=1 Tax=Sinimarinibacterium flocculans TaxID=985250 RepID=UPI00249246FF|nr:hypothetical protein [Sinimarinibacterium flocculans]MEC9361812.1 hypothetical protein [Pseudomonadota bacterium]